MVDEWTDEALLRQKPADIAFQFAKAAAAADARIIRFSTQVGDCYRVGGYTSSPELRRLTIKLREAIRLLEQADRISPVTDQVWELTEKGFEWAEGDGGEQIPINAVVPLDLLLRAGIAPKNWAHAFSELEPLARDETLDALDQGALPVSQLIFEWAATQGQIDLLSTQEHEVEVTEFYDALFALCDLYDIELSVPLDPKHHDLSSMPPFPGQRINLVNRSDWMPFPRLARDEDFTSGELAQIDAYDPPPDLPALTDAGVRFGNKRIGEAWVRIAPADLQDLQDEPVALIKLLVLLANTRVAQVQDTIREQQERFGSQDIAKLTELLSTVSSWQRVVNDALLQLDRVPQHRQTEAAAAILHIIKERPPVDARAQQLDELVTELDKIIASKPIDDHGAGKAFRLSHWHDRVTRYLREHCGDATATKFLAINATSGEVNDLPRWTTEFRTFLLALQRDVIDHPDHYKPTLPFKPSTEPTTTKQVGPWGYALLTGIGLTIAAALIVLLIKYSPSLAADGTLDRIYYLALVVLGLATAGFLFGAMRSYATFKGKVLKGTLELGGPAVVAGLVIIGGFILAPRATTFTVTVRVVDMQHRPIRQGTLTLRAAAATTRLPINDFGETDFRELPTKFRGTSAELVADVPGYVQERTDVKLTEVVTLTLKPSQ